MKKLVLLVVVALFTFSCTKQTVESENYENQIQFKDKSKSTHVGQKSQDEEDHN